MTISPSKNMASISSCYSKVGAGFEKMIQSQQGDVCVGQQAGAWLGRSGPTTTHSTAVTAWACGLVQTMSYPPRLRRDESRRLRGNLKRRRVLGGQLQRFVSGHVTTLTDRYTIARVACTDDYSLGVNLEVLSALWIYTFKMRQIFVVAIIELINVICVAIQFGIFRDGAANPGTIHIVPIGEVDTATQYHCTGDEYCYPYLHCFVR